MSLVSIVGLLLLSTLPFSVSAASSAAPSPLCCATTSEKPADHFGGFTTASTHPASAPLAFAQGGYDPGAGAVPLNVSFQQWVTGGVPPYQYAWDFGDNNFSRSNVTGNTTHVYTTAGTFNATLVVNDSANNSVNETLPVIVEATRLNISTPSATPSPSLDVGQTVTLRVNITGAGGYYNITWYGLPPGCTTGNSTTLICHPNGTANRMVSVCARDPEYVSTCGPWLGVEVSWPPQVSEITVAPGGLDANQSVRLSLIVTAFGYGLQSYAWTNLPPGCVSSDDPNLVCTPTSPGTYHVTATATDSNNGTSSVEVTLVVHPDPIVVAFRATPSRIDLGASVLLVANVTGGFGSFAYQWMDLPNGCSSSNASQILCTPNAPCTCGVSVVATDQTGFVATGETSLQLEIGSKFSATTKLSQSTLRIGSSLWVNSTPTGGVAPFTFSFFGLPSGCAPANTSTLLCTPNETGTFDIEVEAQDSAGAQSFADSNLTVSPQSSPASGWTVAGVPSYVVIGLSIAVVVIAAAVVLAIARARRRKSGGQPPAAESTQIAARGSISGGQLRVSSQPNRPRGGRVTFALIVLITAGLLWTLSLVFYGGPPVLSVPELIVVILWLAFAAVIFLRVPKPSLYPTDRPPSLWDRLP